ncbi:MAG: FGGY-family carbohydrate kinase [Defluviitaleaceae bacterium]|nr:FGGY-family carbohydrate kinase [Defluviitaleaceae bacterium]
MINEFLHKNTDKTFLGIECGSTRIKAVLTDENYRPVASGTFDWENSFENGLWTYSLKNLREGAREAFRKLSNEYENKFKTPLTTVGAMGVSAMMHGYLAFGSNNQLLAPFRTWRNTTTEPAAKALIKQFHFNVPQRWSIAHLYQAVLNNEPHVKEIAFMTTLAGYVHWQLTGEKVLGVGDASGMFPIENGDYNSKMCEDFYSLYDGLKIKDVFPRVLNAGEFAGRLSAEGANFLDPSGVFLPGVPLCPPEGDAGTGMVATNSITERTGNISAGTSVFAMIVLEKALSKIHTEIDIVTTPDGKPVAMVHCNNCTSDLDAWINLFGEVLGCFGADIGTPQNKAEMYEKLYTAALSADFDNDGLLAYNFFSGEPIVSLEEGRPLFVRKPSAKFTLADFMRTLLFSALGTLRLGMDILAEEDVRLEQLLGHGGFFKTKGVGQKFMAAALNTPVSVTESAGEGGAWGIALLAAYMKKRQNNPLSLSEFLAKDVFAEAEFLCETPDPMYVKSFEMFLKNYKKGLAIEKVACEVYPCLKN